MGMGMGCRGLRRSGVVVGGGGGPGGDATGTATSIRMFEEEEGKCEARLHQH